MARYVTSAAVNEARDKHFVYNGVSGLYERSLLLEGSSTNLCLQSEDFGTTWTTGGTTTRTAAAIPASVMGVALDLLGDNDGAAAASWSQNITFTADGTKAVSLYMKKGASPAVAGSRIQLQDTSAAATRLQAVVTWDASGVPTATMAVGTLQETPREIANGVYRVQFIVPSVVAANVNTLYVIPATTAAQTGDVYAGGVQAENNAFCTSYVKTTTATVTRSADSCSLPFTLPPQEMTVYAKFIERGTIGATGNPRVFQIGNAASANPRFVVSTTGTVYVLTHQTAAGAVTSAAAAGPAIGDQVEIRAVLGADGTVTLGQSINGAAEVVAATSAAQALASAWSDTKLWLNSVGSTRVGYSAFQSVKIARGTKTLAEMRAL